jgi:hypothetical protein
MKHVTLTITKIEHLIDLADKLKDKVDLEDEERDYIFNFLSMLPESQDLLIEKVPLMAEIPVNLWSAKKMKRELKTWQTLFKNLPWKKRRPRCEMTSEVDFDKLWRNVFMTGYFMPSMTYDMEIDNEQFELEIMDNGNAVFNFPSSSNALDYHGLYVFKGTWKEAYLLLIDTLKKGWPIEEFPEELKPLLKK